jgi:hypothetical protein
MPYCTKSARTEAAKRVHAIPGPIGELPDGTVIAAVGEAYTIVQGRARSAGSSRQSDKSLTLSGC